jgi:hypothetical protein
MKQLQEINIMSKSSLPYLSIQTGLYSQLAFYTQCTYIFAKNEIAMTTFEYIIGGVTTTFAGWIGYLMNGGYKKNKDDGVLKIVSAVEKAGNMLARSNDALQKKVEQMTVESEESIKAMEKKFELKEQQMQLQIDNLKLENKNLKLENANLLIENERLNKMTGKIRKMG